jgi:hypothetical protein
MREPVTVFGIDFTSAPSDRKPITCARAIYGCRAVAAEPPASLTGRAGEETYGFSVTAPAELDRLEGWIANPALAAAPGR